MIEELIAKFDIYLLTEKCVSRNTFSAYKTDITQFSNFIFSQEFAIESVSEAQIKHYLRYMKSKRLNARTMCRKISSLKIFFSYLSKHMGWKNPMDLIGFPRIDRKLPCYFSEEEIDLLLRAAHHDRSHTGIRNKVILYMLYATGMRISELIRIKMADLHFDSQVISITGKGGKGRMIPLPTPMIKVLSDYIKDSHQLFLKKGEKSDFLFPVRYRGALKSITRQACWAVLKNLWKKTGIKQKISPHKLRHSFATHMLKRGANLRSLQLLLGHEHLATVQIYTHVETSYLRKIYDKKHPRS